MSVYQTAAWQDTRATFLRNHPTCVRCGARATEADHVLPRRQLVEAGFHNPDAPELLQSLCGSCHRRKSVEEDGAFGRASKPIQER
jgi:5-methylcytosine-specific restriction enzyme A